VSRRGAFWRGPAPLVLLVAGCLAAPLALCAAYVHFSIVDRDGYVATIAPVAADLAVQEALADAISGRLTKALRDAGAPSTFLPEELSSLAGELTDALPLDELTRTTTEEVLQGAAFEGYWREGNRMVHPFLIDALENAGTGKETKSPVPLDLSAVTDVVLDRLAQAGVEVPQSLAESLRTGRITLFDSLLLRRLGRVIVVLDRLWLPLAALAVAALAACVAVARDRLRAAALAGAGLVVTMAGLEVGLAAARGAYLGMTDRSHIPRAASAAVFDIMTRSLRGWGWTVLALGAVTVVACVLAALVLSRRPGGRAA
jgi:hypothetical protein